MAIDPSIALGVKPMQLDSPLNSMGQMMALRNASQENQLRQFQMQQSQQDAQRNEMLRQSLSGIDTSTPEGQDAYGRALLKSGNVEQAQKFAIGRATQDKEQRAADSAKIKLASDQTELGIKLLSGAVDQPTYDAARARMQQNGLDISKMPPAFSAEYRDSELRQGVEAKTLLERHLTDLGGMVQPTDFAGQARGAPMYKTATPGELLTDRRAREKEIEDKGDPETTIFGAPVTDAAGNVHFFNKFGREINPGVGKGMGKPTATFEKTKAQQKQLGLDLDTTISELERATAKGGLIEKGTSSGIGALMDLGGQAVGYGTEGSVAIGALKPIYDKVLKMVPRFEGPQSDKDTASYAAAAGDLANPNIPTNRKMAAAKEILRLMKARKAQFLTRDMAEGGAGAETGNWKDL